MLAYASYSDIGGRPYNEDTVMIRTMGEDRLCAVLADGLGGHGGGDRASRTAAELICEGWDGDGSTECLARLAAEANQRILSMQTPQCRMKTTVVILSVSKYHISWAYAGDSRLYHFTHGSLSFQTKDHSASQLAVMLGQIRSDEIRFHEDRSRIFRVLGQEDGPGVETGELNASHAPAEFLLCSDGFWEYVYEEEMEQTLAASGSPEDWLRRMRSIQSLRRPENCDNNSAITIWLR